MIRQEREPAPVVPVLPDECRRAPLVLSTRAPLIECARVAAALVVIAAVTALLVHLFAVAAARQFLGLTFPGVPHRFATVESIFLGNARMLSGVMLACVIVRAATCWSGAGLERALAHAGAVFCDIVLATEVAFNTLLVAAAYGAYGRRALWGTVPHGPFELAAFSLGLSAYIAARRGRLTRSRLLTSFAAGIASLAVGAVLEVLAH